jgi:hypothetical protein
MRTMIRPLNELVEFIAAGATSNEVAQFQVSPESKEIVANLIYKEKTSGLTPQEAADLDSFMKFEHVMRLAKARARILSASK